MKKLFLTGVALTALFSGSAMAADLRVVAPMYKAAYFNWTGCYVGGHGGYAKSSYDQHLSFDDVSSTPEQTFTDSLSPKGGVGGIQGGCNYQMGNIVYGVEGDYTWMNATDSRAYRTDPDTTDAVAFSAKTKSLWSVRGRVGVAHDRALVYLTAGWGGANFDYTYALIDQDAGVNAASLSFGTSGIVFGAGVEYAWLNPWINNLILRAEYLHYALGEDKLLLPRAPTGPWVQDHINLKSVDVIRVGASYKFM